MALRMKVRRSSMPNLQISINLFDNVDGFKGDNKLKESQLETEKEKLTSVLSDSSSSNDDIMNAGTKLSEVVSKIETITERWMELAEFI